MQLLVTLDLLITALSVCPHPDCNYATIMSFHSNFLVLDSTTRERTITTFLVVLVSILEVPNSYWT